MGGWKVLKDILYPGSSISHRSNYAWDLGALNSNMMSYSNYGTRNTDFEVFQKTVILPMDGKVVTVVREVHRW